MTQLITRLIGLSPSDCYTLAIEVSIRNGNLAILLSGTLFANATAAEAPISAGALYVALFYGGAALVLAILGIWSKLLISRFKTRATVIEQS
jgi:predicted Na+-dependent transporter